MNSFGFILTRHVNSELSNRYWNHSVKLLRILYPERKIVIIDDNSNKNFLKADYNYNNVEIINSEFHGRGELLPYYYYIKNKFFENAVILHDSVFIHRRINFNVFNKMKVLPLWHFNSDNENIENTKKIIKNLHNSQVLYDKLKNKLGLGMPNDNWYGCFGVQTYINHSFLLQIEQKYRITNMIKTVLCRADRCCLERIMGCIFYTEFPQILKIKSILGNISSRIGSFRYTFDKYNEHLKKRSIPRVVVKVWSGR